MYDNLKKSDLGVSGGISLRDCIATEAMKELIGRGDADEILNPRTIAQIAYEFSEAMLKQRDR
jgi:hypothetical protein